ncbi:MAG: hypothetical protein KDD44_10785, partial [Bdellovibrionales bacterium]|nr:hypothetical protein [Bdellovibrionales bacterium]
GRLELHVQSGRKSLSARSMVYFYRKDSSLLTMYAAPAVTHSSSDLQGGYNLFLNFANWLRVYNTGNTASRATVTVYSGGIALRAVEVDVPAHGGADVGLHGSTFALSQDTYGRVEISGNNLVADILRVRYQPTLDPAFIMATSTN